MTCIDIYTWCWHYNTLNILYWYCRNNHCCRRDVDEVCVCRTSVWNVFIWLLIFECNYMLLHLFTFVLGTVSATEYSISINICIYSQVHLYDTSGFISLFYTYRKKNILEHNYPHDWDLTWTFLFFTYNTMKDCYCYCYCYYFFVLLLRDSLKGTKFLGLRLARWYIQVLNLYITSLWSSMFFKNFVELHKKYHKCMQCPTAAAD